MSDIVLIILFCIAIALIILDFVTGRKNNRIITFLSIVIAAVLPLLYYIMPNEVKQLNIFALFMLCESYLCLRLFTSKYLFLQEQSSGKIDMKGGKNLILFAIFFNITSFFAFVIGFVAIVAVGSISFWVGIALMLSFLWDLIMNNFAALVSSVGTGLFALLYLLPILFITALQALLFLLTPIVMALRGLKGASRTLGLSAGKIVCYVMFLLLPYLNIIPLIILWIRCFRYGRKQISSHLDSLD